MRARMYGRLIIGRLYEGVLDSYIQNSFPPLHDRTGGCPADRPRGITRNRASQVVSSALHLRRVREAKACI